MKKILYPIKFVLFVTAMSLLLQILLSSKIDYKPVKNEYVFSLSVDNANEDYFNSDIFLKIMGTSFSDVLRYSDISITLSDVPKSKRSVSANELGLGDNYDKDIEEYSSLYDAENTNLKYFISTNIDGKTKSFSNVNESFELDDIDTDNDKYIYYESNEDEYKSNINIEKSTVKKILEQYQDSFGDNYTVVFALDSTLKINDSFRTSYDIYKDFSSNLMLKIVLIFVCAFLYLAITVYLSIYFIVTSRKHKESKTNITDTIPFEVRLALFFICLVPYVFVTKDFDRALDYIFLVKSNSINLFYIYVLVFFGILELLINFFYFGLIRRFFNGQFFKTSFICKFILLIFHAIKDTYNHVEIFIKYIFTLAVLFLINIVCGVFYKNLISYCILLLVDCVSLYYIYRSAKERKNIDSVLEKISNGDIEASLNLDDVHGENKVTGEYVNKIGAVINDAVETSLKDEKMKADLITNVSHDLKTPLTSIINYVDLLKKENIDSQKAKEYIDILDSKSQRLKQMTEDLVEASKISSGNVVLNLERINLNDLILQSEGEFIDRFNQKNLTIVTNMTEQPLFINADSRSIFRVIENLYINIYKYALEGTRVYIDLKNVDNKAFLSIKNISKTPLEVEVSDLTERFVRGDKSRTTEGSGLGLSISKNLVLAMNGDFEISVDADLFKVLISFDLIP